MSEPTPSYGEVTDEQRRMLARYVDLLLEANKTMNLTGVKDRAAAELLHVGDALTLLPFLPNGPMKLADVGSGGGCPGIPLAIVRPEAQVTCIEATKKKAEFLRATAEALGLKNLSVLADRAETVGRGQSRQTFHVAVARAVGAMLWVAEYCLPLVKNGGKMLAMKGPKATEELAAAVHVIRKLGGGKPLVHAVALPGADGHVVVEIAKIRGTDGRYPRLATEAKGKPMS